MVVATAKRTTVKTMFDNEEHDALIWWAALLALSFFRSLVSQFFFPFLFSFSNFFKFFLFLIFFQIRTQNYDEDEDEYGFLGSDTKYD